MEQGKGGTSVTNDPRFSVPLFTIEEGSRHLGIAASTGPNGYRRRRRTSRESRMASPIMLNATTVMIRMRAGG